MKRGGKKEDWGKGKLNNIIWLQIWSRYSKAAQGQAIQTTKHMKYSYASVIWRAGNRRKTNDTEASSLQLTKENHKTVKQEGIWGSKPFIWQMNTQTQGGGVVGLWATTYKCWVKETTFYQLILNTGFVNGNIH